MITIKVNKIRFIGAGQACKGGAETNDDGANVNSFINYISLRRFDNYWRHAIQPDERRWTTDGSLDLSHFFVNHRSSLVPVARGLL
jgi:hypothetical protein